MFSTLPLTSSEDVTVSQFISNTMNYPTLGISTCHHKSGCHSFGDNLFAALQCSHIAGTRDDGGPIVFFEEKITATQPYHYVSITGCINHDPEFLIASQKKYDLTELKHVY